jgi:hypothetical protein
MFLYNTAVDKARSVKQGDMVSWNASGGRASGKVVRVVSSGTLSVPDSKFQLKGDKDNPAVLIQLYRDGKPTEKKVGHKLSSLTKSIDVIKHGSHDQKTHGRGGKGGGGGGGSSSASSASSSSEEKELDGLADSAESDSQSLQNEAEDTQLELMNSGMSNNSPDVRTAKIMSQSLKNANKSFKEAKEAKSVDAKKGKLRSGYNSLNRAFDVSNNSEINTLEDIAEGIGRTMEKLEQGLGLDSRS